MLLTGCLSLARPSKRHREEASARAAKELVAHRSKLEKVTFLVLDSDRPASFEVSSHEDKLYFNFVDPKGACALATGISEDGYLMTAAHVTRREQCYVVGWMDGKPAVSTARVVYRQLGKEFGEELAILHVDKHLDCPIQLGTLDSAESEIYAFALDRQSGVKFIVVAGKVVRRPKPNPGEDLSTMAADLPLWKGDSGGAVMSKDGKLVGVFVGVDIPLTTLKNSAIACVPDMDRVLSIIAKDRLKANAPSTEQSASLNAEQAKTIAMRLANDKAFLIYNRQPFRDGQPACFVAGRWVWVDHQGYGLGDIQATVELAADGSTHRVDLILLDSRAVPIY